jgi:WD40 repeat protein
MLRPRILLSLVLFFLALRVSGDDRQPETPFFDDTGGSMNDCFCVSKDGKKLALNAWTVWDIPSGKKVTCGNTHGAHATAFSPDGSLLAVGGNYSELYIYNAHTGEVFWDLTFVGHADSVLDHVEFTPDGQFLLSSSDNGMLRVWNLKNKTAQALFCFTSKYERRNGFKEYLRAWRALAGNEPPDKVQTFVVFEKPIEMLYQFSIHPDGKSVAIALGTSDVLLLELATGKVLKTFHTSQLCNLSVRFSQDGKLLAVGGGDAEHDTKKCTVEVWDVAAATRLVTCPGHRHSVLHMAFSPDNKLIVSGGTIDGVRIWDVATGKQKFALQQGKEDGRNDGVAFLPSGKAFLTLLGREHEPVRFWDAETGKPLSLIEKNQPK